MYSTIYTASVEMSKLPLQIIARIHPANVRLSKKKKKKHIWKDVQTVQASRQQESSPWINEKGRVGIKVEHSNKEFSQMLVIFYFSIFLLVVQLCLLCDDAEIWIPMIVWYFFSHVFLISMAGKERAELSVRRQFWNVWGQNKQTSSCGPLSRTSLKFLSNCKQPRMVGLVVFHVERTRTQQTVVLSNILSYFLRLSSC